LKCVQPPSCANVPSDISLKGWLLARWTWFWIWGGGETIEAAAAPQLW
jgi:hypothetical protein